MGTVYRAVDQIGGGPVALKVMESNAGLDVERFARETRLLAELAHPSIVRYVSHGVTADHRPFLAMEWLGGEDLGQRIARAGALAPAEAIAIARRACEGLSLAHTRGIVHRDIKPSNIYLVDGDAERAKLLDFGIARAQAGRVTRTGLVLGTIGYMAPEQAQGERDVDARADVFALGCVLHECLTGRAAFGGDHALAVLMKVMLEHPPRVREVRPEISAELEDLVARMLAKSREDRPKHAADVLRALEELPATRPSARVRASTSVPPGMRGERRMAILVVAQLGASPTGATLSPEAAEDDMRDARAIAERFGATVSPIAGEAIVISCSDAGNPTTEASRAGACALALSERFPDARIAVSAGRAESTGVTPLGPVIDRASALLGASTTAGVCVDEVAAALVGERFSVRSIDGVRILSRAPQNREGEREHEHVRTLLGKPTPCVGREKELALLEGTLAECIDESVARALVVTGAAGSGKSRVRDEFVRSARARATVLVASADPIGAGSALGLARQLVRRAAKIADADPPAAQLARLRAYVADRLHGPARMAEMLGELVGCPSPDKPSPQLQSARSDPRIMGDWIRRSFEEWLAAETARAPVVVVLDDLHWGDLPTVTYLDGVLHKLADRALMVLAFARPEVRDAFPSLWSAAEPQEIRLAGLTKRAAERLVRDVLGESAAPDVVARVVERAGGNAFYLEELIRRAAEGDAAELPETVLAMVESRLARVESEGRRVLRAASVFGEVFWAGGVTALMGAEEARAVAEWLGTLCDRELIAERGESRFAGEKEYAFRHALLRDATYATLTDGDRVAGHASAAEWLEEGGEQDALVMAEHYDRGGRAEAAVPWFAKAAQAALDGINFEAAIALAERGIAAGATGEIRGTLRSIQGQAHCWRTEWDLGIERATEAMTLLPKGGAPWFLSAGGTVFASGASGKVNASFAVVQEILALPTSLPPSGPYGLAVYALVVGLRNFGQRELAAMFLARLEETARAGDAEELFVAWLMSARIIDDIRSGPGAGIDNARRAVRIFEACGDDIGASATLVSQGHILLSLGAPDEAATVVRRAKDLAGRGVSTIRNHCINLLGLQRMAIGAWVEARETFMELNSATDIWVTTVARALIAETWRRTGDIDRAEELGRAALDDAAVMPWPRSIALQTLAAIDHQRGRHDAALARIDEALALDVNLHDRLELLHTRTEALYAKGLRERAETALVEARDLVESTARNIPEERYRHSFLTGNDVTIKILALAKERLPQAHAR
jgi:tetratricopeptide (TPR) repeat protein